MIFQIIEFSLFLLPPLKIVPTTTLGHLDEGPCNMGESKHEPSVEICWSQEALKLGQCGWGWPVMDKLDLN
jgi:hypothetical protein